MPKQNINDHVTDGFRAEVLWTSAVPGERDGYVQIGTTNAASPFRFPPEPDSTDEQGEDFAGWFVSLDRAGCNRAIRALRKARDAAYGADA